MGKEVNNLIKIWGKFVENQKNSRDAFKLNPSKEKVIKLAEGVLSNEKNHGLKYCPCRLTTGRKEEDLKLICPCNFKVQKTWQNNGECWCSLFVKS